MMSFFYTQWDSFSSNAGMLVSALAVCLVFFVLYNTVRVILSVKKRKENSSVEVGHNKFARFLKLFFSSKAGLGINIFLGIALLLTGAGLAVAKPRVSYPTAPSLGVTEITDTNPLVITFDRPVDSASIVYQISPSLLGSWKFGKNILGLSDSLTFTPEESPRLDTRYTISISGIKNILGVEKQNYLFSFATPSLPEVISVDPKDGMTGILPNQKISIKTDNPHERTALFKLKVTPEVPLDLSKKDDFSYIASTPKGFEKGTTYKLEISRTLATYNYKTKKIRETEEVKIVWTGTFQTVEPPSISDYGPKGSGILVESGPWVSFKQDMDKVSTEKSFTISPTTPGTFSWESKKMIFRPAKPLQKNTKYTITLAKTALATDQSPIPESLVYSFTTIGPVSVTEFTPANNAYNVDLGAKINVHFNQAVDHASAESKFSISPNVSGTFSWSGNTLVFSHSGMSYYTKYAATISSGVKTVYGLDSVQAFSSSFTTKQQTVMLNIPSYRQTHMYSCMASAARQALAYRGVLLSEDTILSAIGYDYTPFSGTWGGADAVWGNPNTGVAGNVDGKSGGVSWGYGSHWGPTAKAISNWRSAEVKNGWSVQGIAQEIAKGNPVIVWWVNGVWPAYNVNWKTTDGQTINGVNSMHVQTVKGFTGTVDNPTTFTVNDSGYGYPSRTFDVTTFKAKWSWFGNSAVIVH